MTKNLENLNTKIHNLIWKMRNFRSISFYSDKIILLGLINVGLCLYFENAARIYLKGAILRTVCLSVSLSLCLSISLSLSLSVSPLSPSLSLGYSKANLDLIYGNKLTRIKTIRNISGIKSEINVPNWEKNKEIYSHICAWSISTREIITAVKTISMIFFKACLST